jgi:ABC-type transport system involved in Fe-S cluster assembly fused permease/ATPase subunit
MPTYLSIMFHSKKTSNLASSGIKRGKKGLFIIGADS